MSNCVTIIVLLCLLPAAARAQISPGELSSAHAAFEGIGQCTKCHSIGKALSDDNCTACHTEIRTRMREKKGYHATIGAKHCSECHKEHHGRQFAIIRFDAKSFDHASVGFALEGGHAKTECRQCHAKEKIAAADVQALSPARRQSTYLGLSRQCTSCHADRHMGQFTAACSSCHTFEQWKPAARFSHARARFQLTGRHATVGCAQCHRNTLPDGKTVQYVRIEFGSCASCHTDPHKGKFTQACSHCHTTDDFRRVQGTKFDHASTLFPLRGKHANVKCEQCHSNNPKGRNVSGETGFHITKFRSCRNCHEDAHAAQFDRRPDGGRCEACHTEEGFRIARFTPTDHATTRFPLTGAHLAIACAKCHETGKVRSKSTRQFRWEGTLECITCHSDIHGGQFATRMTKGCPTCHTTDSWQSLTFSHEDTKFPLRGRHGELRCAECHKQSAAAVPAVRYAGTPMRCADCHADEHASQFAVNGQTDCTRCHQEKGWKALTFNHAKQSRFELTGKHASVACSKCHPTVSMSGRARVNFKPLGTSCTDCHERPTKSLIRTQ